MTGVASELSFCGEERKESDAGQSKAEHIQPSGGDADWRWRGWPFGYFGFGLQPVFDFVAGLSSALLIELKSEESDFVVVARFGCV